jgi:hypothetical protein
LEVLKSHSLILIAKLFSATLCLLVVAKTLHQNLVVEFQLLGLLL